ncbi:DUF1549 domain-containing protein, partial [bacterium]
MSPLDVSAEAPPRGWLLAALGLVSAGGWAWLAFAFPATSSRRDVLAFLTVIAALFLLSAAALPAARGRTALRQILLFAALFRGLLLFAGLPPRPPEISEFLLDHRPEACERLVDRLLASPHYGERLAVWWLDLVRYADSVGYHGDQLIS